FDLIDYLAARFSHGSLRVLGLARPELLARRPAWSDAALLLKPLSDRAVADLVTRMLDHGEVPPRALRHVVDTAGGNPLFARELARMLGDDGVLRPRAGCWELDESRPVNSAPPATITAVLTARFDQLETSTRDVLAAASVVGESFGRRAV